MLQIKIETGNAAFHNEMTGEKDSFAEAIEVTRILNEVRSQIREGRRSGSCIDINGNRVGNWSFDD